MLHAAVMLLAVCLLALPPPGSASAQQLPVPAQSALVDPATSQLALRNQIVQLAHEERELKRQGRPPGYLAQLITAAALGGTGVLTGVVAITSLYVRAECECGPSHALSIRLIIGGFATLGVAGIWAFTIANISRARTDRAAVRRLREERRGLQQEYQRVQRVYAPPTTLSLLLAPQQVGLRATY